MRVFLIFGMISCLAFGACKNTSPSPEPKEEKVVQDTMMTTAAENKMGAGKIAQLHKQAEAILAYRRENKPDNYAIIDVGVWEYEAAFKDGAMSKPGAYKGHWIDFSQDNSYEFGINGNIQGKGKYHYDNDTHLLLLVNDDPNVKPEEYEIKLVNEVMIMMGNLTYQDNGFQAKLLKIQKRPGQ